MSSLPSPPCARSRMKQLLWHLPLTLAGCQPRSLVVTLHFWYSSEFRQDGKWSCTEQVLLFLLPRYCFSSESCRQLFKAECYPPLMYACVWEGEMRYWAGEQARPPQSQLRSNILTCSKRTLRYVAKNSPRRFFFSCQTVRSVSCFQQGEFCNIWWEVGAVPQHNLNILHCLISNF